MPDCFRDIAFPAAGNVVVAFSGGSDSTALLLLLHDHLRANAPDTVIQAVTVDHGLRRESAAEARRAADFCAGLGISHRTMIWEGEKPATGISASARAARYRLLARAADACGARLILTAHTSDDQAETVLMRKGRGDGRGLAGMARETLLDGRYWVLRPLLSAGREELRAFLRMRGVSWIDDPSNADLRYERVRARGALAGAADPAMRARLLEEAEAAAAPRRAEGRAAAAAIDAHARLVSPGLVRIGPPFASCQGAHLALRALLAAIGGRDQLADERRAGALLSRIGGEAFRASLAGAVVDARKAGVFLHRERRAGWTGSVPARAGTIWDGRFLIVRDGPPGSVAETAGPALAAASAKGDAEAPAALVRAGLAAEPVLRQPGGGGVGEASATLPFEAGFVRLPGPWQHFLPGFDLDLADAVSRLLGCREIPPRPSRGHNAAYSA